MASVSDLVAFRKSRYADPIKAIITLKKEVLTAEDRAALLRKKADKNRAETRAKFAQVASVIGTFLAILSPVVVAISGNGQALAILGGTAAFATSCFARARSETKIQLLEKTLWDDHDRRSELRQLQYDMKVCVQGNCNVMKEILAPREEALVGKDATLELRKNVDTVYDLQGALKEIFGAGIKVNLDGLSPRAIQRKIRRAERILRLEQ